MTTQTDSMRSTPDDTSSSPAADAQAKAQEVVGRAHEQAEAISGQTQDRIREQVEQRSAQLGEQIDSQASDLRSVSEALRDQGKDRPAQAVDRLAGYAEQAGNYLHARAADSILADAENFGRERPGAVAAGALAIGFLASRFLKASSGRRYASRGTTPEPGSSAGLPESTSIDPVTAARVAPAMSEQPVSKQSPATVPPVASSALPGI
jgi:hypothetical protein